MDVQSIFIVECRCGTAIALPPQSPLGIFQPPRPQPNQNKWPANFVCPDCGQWFSRPQDKIRQVENASLVQSLTGASFWRVDFACNRRGCKRHISSYIVFPESSSANGVAAFVRSSSGLKCAEHGLLLQLGESILVQQFPYLWRST